MKHAIIYDGTTDIESYQVVDTIYGDRSARVLYDRDRRAAQSGKPLDGGEDMLFDYNERFMEIARAVMPHRVLVLGGGAFTLPQALLEELPDLELDIVELDGGLVDIAEGFFDFKPSKNTCVHITDARTYLDANTKQYDLVIVDVFMETSIPLSVQTKQAAVVLERALTPNGVIAMNIIAAYHGQRAAALRRQVAAWAKLFSFLALVPASTGYSLWLPQNFVLIASRNKIDVDAYMRHSAIDLPGYEAADAIND